MEGCGGVKEVLCLMALKNLETGVAANGKTSLLGRFEPAAASNIRIR